MTFQGKTWISIECCIRSCLTISSRTKALFPAGDFTLAHNDAVTQRRPQPSAHEKAARNTESRRSPSQGGTTSAFSRYYGYFTTKVIFQIHPSGPKQTQKTSPSAHAEQRDVQSSPREVMAEICFSSSKFNVSLKVPRRSSNLDVRCLKPERPVQCLGKHRRARSTQETTAGWWAAPS